MLRNVLDAYLDTASERELDVPILSLLAAMGFFDIHFTHGQVEFGKDFIAKRVEDGVELQYSFQSKVGDISQADWRNDIQGQILESVLTSLSHPNFDTRLPHQAVLMTTGDLRGNAGPAFQNLNATIEQTYQKRPILFWSRQNLLDLFESHSLASLYDQTGAGITEYAQFFLIYGKALQGALSDREIEHYSRHWLAPVRDRAHRVFRAAIEAEAIAQQCAAHGFFYEASIAHLSLIRVILSSVYMEGVDTYTSELYTQALARLQALNAAALSEIQRQWENTHDLLSAAQGQVSMTSYLVQCTRIIDLAALVFFTATSSALREEAGAFLVEFVNAEPGCSHPLSDRYAISVVLATLVLCDRQKTRDAHELLRRVTVWLCDREEEGVGLAGFEADEAEETATLLGFAFSSVNISTGSGCFLAAALCDLAAFVGNRALYADILNDIKACHILPEYWQPADTWGVCCIDSDNVI